MDDDYLPQDPDDDLFDADVGDEEDDGAEGEEAEREAFAGWKKKQKSEK